MAFANRFHFRFDSIHGVEYNIYILQDGYSGECENRKLGRAPVLRKQKNGPVCGTSLDLYAECAPGHDGEFAALFTSNPKEYRVDVKRKVSGTDVLIWQGFVSTELYSEPSIYPPYDVQIVATDGLGELKLVDFIPVGITTLSQHFRTALAYTGMNRTIYVASSLIMTGESATDTFEMSINLDYMEGDSYYDVVTKLLDTLHATITMYGDKWLIARETDLPALLSGSGLSVVSIAADGTVSTTTIGGVHKTVGSMADNSVDTWPVGQLSTAINPARKKVTVEAPWHTVSGPDDPNMEETTGSPWGTEGIVRHDTTDDCFYELGLDPNNPQSDDTWGTIKQEIPINKLDCGFQLKLRVAPRVYKLRVGDAQWYAHGNIKVHLEYDCYISSGSHSTQHTSTYIGTEEGWSGAPQHESDPKVEIPTTDLDSIGERWLSINIPAISTPDSASRYIVADYAIIRIVIEGHWVDVYECILTPSLDLPGYRDIIHLDNDAVGAAETVEITGGRVRSDNLVNSKFYGGIWIFNGAIVTSFADSVHSNGDFLSITALSYALSVAGRRLKTEGKLNIPADFSVIPLFITFEEIISWIETWEWDLIQEEAQVSAISLPAVEVQVESETIDALPEDGSGGSGGTGNGSSSSSAYSYKNGGSSFFEEDGEGGVKLKDEYDGLWAAGFITAGGVGSGSGGGSSVDLPRVWQSLQNANAPVTPTASTKIAAEHLISTNPDEPVGLIIGSGLSYDSVNRILSATGGAAGTVSGIKLGTSSAYTPDSSGIVALPAYPTTLANPYALTFGSKTYDGSAAKTITASDLGALTAVPKATNSVIGGFQTGYSESGKNYAVQMSGDKAFVNVPWTDTVYTHPTNGANTTISAANGKVLSAITVNNLGHVTSVSSKTLAAVDIPDLSGTYLPLSAGTGKALTGVLKIAPSNVSGVQDGIILHDAGTGQNEGLKITWTSGSYTTGVSLYPNSNLTGLTIGGNLIITAGNYMNYALPLSAGSSYPLTNTLYVSTGNGISDSTGNGLLVYHPTSWTGVSSSKWGVGAIDCQGVIRSDNTSLLHYRNGVTNASVIYDSDNANKIDVAWACSNLTASGTIHATGGIDSDSYITAGAAATSSDRRMKYNIEAVHSDRALSVLMQLNPCEWEWNDRNAFLCGKRGAGLVAQEVQEILPFAVVDLGDYLYLNYSVFHAYEIKGLQNHEARISTLEAEVIQLLKENEELKARLNA